MRKLIACLGTLAVMSVPTVAAAETWSGRISDAMCNAKHADGEHGTKKMTDRQCVEACVKGGEKYVFVSEKDKVYKIANQDLAALKAHAGHEVIVTGTMKDDTVTITKIEMPAKK
jgi:hypothetical protein